MRQARRELRRAVKLKEPVTHPGPPPPEFLERFYSDTREGRKLRRLGKPPGKLKRAWRRLRGGGRRAITVLRGLAGHWEAASPRADHAQCAGQVAAIRAYHVTHGYSDIAYSFLFCNHGQVFVGRGWGSSAATCNQTWNNTHASACWLGGPGHVPTSAAYGALATIARDARARGATSFIGHRDACSTQCPGNELHARMHSPALFDGGPPPEPPKPRTSQNRSNEMFPRNTDGNVYLLTGGVLRWLSPDEWGAMQLFAGQDGVLAKSVQMDNGLRLIQLARMYGVPDAQIEAALGVDLGASAPG